MDGCCKYRLKIIKLWADFMKMEVDDDLVKHFEPYDNIQLLAPFLREIKRKSTFGNMANRYNIPKSTLKSRLYRMAV